MGSPAEALAPSPAGPQRRPPATHVSSSRPKRAGGARALPHRLGRYVLFDHVGRGGMADIYLAKAETSLGGSRLVVIKEVLPALAHDQRFAELLVSEAKLAARLRHANVVQVEDLGRHDGALFIAMEYVEGFDLRELLRRCASERVPMPIEFSLFIVTEVLRALDHAHRQRDDEGKPRPVVHRDVSPSNVLVSLEGEVKLCDFGIARAHDASVEPTIEGKAGYMSPEQAGGEPLDARADVFAAGIILWEMLAGKRLYKAGEGEKLLDVARRAEVPPLPRRGLRSEDALHAIVLRALARHRDDRHGSAASMLRDLETYAMSAGMAASPLRFGAWVREHFGRERIEARRGRERALRAIERGPVLTIEPIAPAKSKAEPTPAMAEPGAPKLVTAPLVEAEPRAMPAVPGVGRRSAPPHAGRTERAPVPLAAAEHVIPNGIGPSDPARLARRAAPAEPLLPRRPTRQRNLGALWPVALAVLFVVVAVALAPR